jgi:hypothetical protein
MREPDPLNVFDRNDSATVRSAVAVSVVSAVWTRRRRAERTSSQIPLFRKITLPAAVREARARFLAFPGAKDASDAYWLLSGCRTRIVIKRRVTASRALLDHEMHANVLMALDRLAVRRGGEETPVVQRGEQQLVQTRLLCRLNQLYIDGAVRVNRKARKRNGVIRGFSQVVRDFRQRLRDRASTGMTAARGRGVGRGCRVIGVAGQ